LAIKIGTTLRICKAAGDFSFFSEVYKNLKQVFAETGKVGRYYLNLGESLLVSITGGALVVWGATDLFKKQPDSK
jgi:hypothetical protein